MKIKCPCCGQNVEIGEIIVSPSPKYKIIAIMGPSACGKTTLLNRITNCDELKQKVHKIKATTTRPRRDNESKDEYEFITEEAFMSAKEQMLEITQFREWYYGTNRRYLDLNKWNIGIFSPAAIKQLAANPQVKLEVFYLRTNEKERIKRSLERENNPDIEEILRRALADRKDFASENLTFHYRTLPSNCSEDIYYAMECTREVINAGQK